MASNASLTPWRLTLPEGMYQTLRKHLFPGDSDEHGAIILAGICDSDRGLRLIARELHLAVDGEDYVPGRNGYRMLRGEFIQSRILRARDMKLVYLAIHNHGGMYTVGFSHGDFKHLLAGGTRPLGGWSDGPLLRRRGFLALPAFGLKRPFLNWQRGTSDAPILMPASQPCPETSSTPMWLPVLLIAIAADTMSARLLFNAIVHQYGIPKSAQRSRSANPAKSVMYFASVDLSLCGAMG